MRSAARFWRATVIATVALAPLHSSCPGIDLPDTGPGWPPDAGHDANDLDAPDTAPDATYDGGPSDPGWVRPEGLPASCFVERAAHPERLPTWTWDSCGPGCRRAQTRPTWWVAEGYFPGGQGWLQVGSDQFGEDVYVIALARADGHIDEAFRFRRSLDRPSCGPFHTTVSDGWLGLLFTRIEGDGRTADDIVFVREASGPTPPTLAARAVGAPFVSVLNHTEELVVSSSGLVALGMTGGNVLLLTPAEVLRVDAGPRGVGRGLAMQEDHLVFAEHGVDTLLRHWTPDAGSEPYWDPAEEVDLPRISDGVVTFIRYVDYLDGLPQRTELWAAGLERDPAALRPRLVHSDVRAEDSAFADGVYGWYDAGETGLDFEAHLVDVETGRERVITAPPGVWCARVFYLSRGDVALQCYDLASGMEQLYRLEPNRVATGDPW